MADCDWDTVYLRKSKPKASQLKSQQAVNAAQRQGLAVETQKKFTASSNKQHSSNKDTAKLDRETEELHHEKITLDVGRIIQQRRGELKMTQKELATKVNEKPQVINDYEGGRAIPNNAIMGKLERTLGVKLRGKDKGQVMVAKK